MLLWFWVRVRVRVRVVSKSTKRAKEMGRTHSRAVSLVMSETVRGTGARGLRPKVLAAMALELYSALVPTSFVAMTLSVYSVDQARLVIKKL